MENILDVLCPDRNYISVETSDFTLVLYIYNHAPAFYRARWLAKACSKHVTPKVGNGNFR